MSGTTVAAEPPTPAVRLPRRRGIEFTLIVLAVLLCVYGYCAVGLAKNGTVPPGAAGYGAGLGVLALLAHFAVRLRAPYADPLLLPIAVLLNGLGLVLIYRLDLETPRDQAAPTQLIWSTLGVALFIAVVLFLRDHRVLQRYTYVSVVTALVLLTLPIFFPAVNGARIWIRIAGFSIQPGEFAKVLLALFFAGYLAANRNALAYTGRQIWRFKRLQLPTGRVLGPIVAIWLLSVGVLVLERDLGTSLLFFGLFVILLYVATGRTGWIAVGLLLAGVGAVAVGWLEPHVHSRVQEWLHPFASIEAGEGPNQIAQSLFAFAAAWDARHRPRARPLHPHRLRRQVGLHPGDRGRGTGPDRPVRDLSALRPPRRARLSGGAHPARPLRAAPRHRARVDRGAPGLRHRGRGDRPDPAHRDGDAVPRTGRVLGRHQLDHRGAADPDQRLGAESVRRDGGAVSHREVVAL